jgi:DNA-binding MarR family transcriptional regulator
MNNPSSLLLLLSASAAVHRDLERGVAQHHLTITQYRVLLALNDASSGMHLADIASLLNLESNTIGAAVGSIHRKGLVERAVDNADRRAVFISLTERGQEELARTTEAIQAQLVIRWEPLTKEEIAFVGGSTTNFAERAWSYVQMLETSNARLDAIFKLEHISMSGFLILLVLAEEGQPVRPRDLAWQLGLKASTTSMAIDALERRHAVARLKNADNGATTVKLEPEGERVLSALHEPLAMLMTSLAAQDSPSVFARMLNLSGIMMRIIERERQDVR